MFVVMSVILLYSLVTHDFSNKYVATYTDVGMPTAYLLAAFWGGEKGALLFWATMLSIFSCLAVYQNKERDPGYMAYTTGTLLAAICFFSLLMVFESSPFERFVTHGGPADGKGMNPQLQNPTMTIHPPSLLTGYIAFTIPFAFGLGALLRGKLDDEWAKDSRVWTIVCWIFLTLGLILGGLWSYEELGWGGYWAWDPVENAGLIPWFTATAFLHSVMIQERRAMLRRWNFFLVVLTFLLTIFGTFLTRSQLIDSIHAFADSTLAAYFLYYMGVITAGGFGALFYRWKELRSDARIEYFLSREFFFVLNNILLLGCAFIVLWGTVFSKVSELEWVQARYNDFIDLYNGTILSTWFGPGEYLTQALVLGEPWFNRVMVPAGLVLLMLTGVGPIISWRRATRKNFNKNFSLPLVISSLSVGVGALMWGVFRVLELRTLELRLLTARWMDKCASWSYAVADGGTAPGPYPELGVFTIGDAYNKWANSLGMDDVFIILAAYFCLFVTCTISIEFYRGGRILQKKHGGGLLTNTIRLMLNNRRRYGGYIIHFGVVLAYVAFAGNAFLEKKEQNVNYGESVNVGEYHVTLVDIRETVEEDGDYLASRGIVALLEEGDTVPPEKVEPIVASLKGAELEPFLVDTVQNSPYVHVRFVDKDSRFRVRQAIFLDQVFRQQFDFVGFDSSGQTVSFRVRNMDIVQRMPMLLHRWMTQTRKYFRGAGNGTKVQTTPGSPVFKLKFESRILAQAFTNAYREEILVPDLISAHYDDEGQVAKLMPGGAGRILYPEVRYYRKHEQPTTEVAIDSYVFKDVYLAMKPEHPGKLHAKMLVMVYPLVSFLWAGALIMLLGGILCLIPLRVVRGFGFRSGSAAGWLLPLLVSMSLIGHGSTAQAQSHSAPSEVILPSTGGILKWDEAGDSLLASVRCQEDGSGRVFREGQDLSECTTLKGQELKERLITQLGQLREERPNISPRRAVDQVLESFLKEDERHENGLNYNNGDQNKLMKTTNCYCGCGDQKALAQCGLECGNAKFWGLRFQVLLAQGYSIDQIRGAYLETYNSSLGPGQEPWTLEDVVVDSDMGVTWMVPFMIVVFALAVFSILLVRARMAKSRELQPEIAVSLPAASGGISEEEREALQEELDDYL